MTPTPINILDLYCGAGGAAMGYHQALTTANIPHTITGVDINPQPNYPFNFIQGDAIEYLTNLPPTTSYDFIHTSPPCQAYSLGSSRNTGKTYPDLIYPTRRALIDYGALYVIENVKGAPIYKANSVRLCGTMFHLGVLRHRWFEFPTSPPPIPEPRCNHRGSVPDGTYATVAGHGGNGSHAYAVWSKAMQIDWMTKLELTQAIPPAYTNYLMEQILQINLLGATAPDAAPDPC